MKTLNLIRNAANAEYIVECYFNFESKKLDNNLAFPIIWEYKIGSQRLSQKRKLAEKKSVLV